MRARKKKKEIKKKKTLEKEGEAAERNEKMKNMLKETLSFQLHFVECVRIKIFLK